MYTSNAEDKYDGRVHFLTTLISLAIPAFTRQFHNLNFNETVSCVQLCFCVIFYIVYTYLMIPVFVI